MFILSSDGIGLVWYFGINVALVILNRRAALVWCCHPSSDCVKTFCFSKNNIVKKKNWLIFR